MPAPDRLEAHASARSAVDWRSVVQAVQRSRALDHIEESQLYPARQLYFQFSARGHDVSQVLLAQQLTGTRGGIAVAHGGDASTASNGFWSALNIAAPVIINQPQVAILGVGRTGKRVVVHEMDGQDAVLIRPMCYVTLTIDHRALDGYQANGFLTQLVETLQAWPADTV